MKRYLLFALSVLFVSTASFASDITGVWYNTQKTAKIKIYKNIDKYYGKIIWLEDPLTDGGEERTDINNPLESKRSKPIIDLVILKKFVSEGKNKYGKGTIYDPENGKTYKCVMTLTDDNTLDVRGYVGVKALGRTETWTRTEE